MKVGARRGSSALPRAAPGCRRRAERHPQQSHRCACQPRSPAIAPAAPAVRAVDGRQDDEALQGRAAVGVEPDMVVERPLARGSGRPGEVEGAKTAGRDLASHDLDHVRIRPARPRARSPTDQRREIDCPVRQGQTDAAMARGSMVGRSPCTLTTTSWRPSGSKLSIASAMRSEPEAWSLRVITACPPAARTLSAISAESVATATGPIPASTARRHTCTIIAPRDVGERLVGQAGGGQAGGDENERIGHGWPVLSKMAKVCHGRRRAVAKKSRCVSWNGPPAVSHCDLATAKAPEAPLSKPIIAAKQRPLSRGRPLARLLPSAALVRRP